MNLLDARTLPGLMDEMARRYCSRRFVTDHQRTLTCGAFGDEVRRFAKGLHALGVRRGDKVALLMGSQAEWLVVDFAVTLLGGVLVPVNTWWKQSELQHALASTDASVLVMVDRYLGNDYTAHARRARRPDDGSAAPAPRGRSGARLAGRRPSLRRADRTRPRRARRRARRRAGRGAARRHRLPAVHLGLHRALEPAARDGRMRILAITTPKRSAALPDMPSVAELGLPDLEAAVWVALLAPRGTDSAMVERLNDSMNRALADGAVRQRLDTIGAEPSPGTPDRLAALIRSEAEKWGDVVRRAKIKAQ